MIGLAAIFCGAISGTPEPPAPGPIPDMAVSWGNDWFGYPGGKDVDDNRTNAIGINYGGDDYTVSFDYSMLTAKDGDVKNGTRIDETTLTLGRIYADNKTFTLAAGTGIRARSKQFGQVLQNGFHRFIGSGDRYQLDYESDNPAAIVYGFAAYRAVNLRSSFLGYPEVLVSSALTSDGEFALDTSLRLVIDNPDSGKSSCGWFGVRPQLRAGHHGTKTNQCVADWENDVYLTYGFQIDVIIIGMEYGLGSSEAVGTFSFTWKL